MADTSPSPPNVHDSDCVPCGVENTQPPTRQGALCWPDPDRFSAQWEKILEILNEIVAFVSLKEAAFVIGVSDKALGHALHERERHYPRFDWLPAIAALAKACGLEERLGAVLVAPLGMVARFPEITDAEWRRRVEPVLRSQGAHGELTMKQAGVR